LTGQIVIEPPRIVMTEAAPIAMLRLRVPGSDMRRVMGPGLAEVTGAIAAQDIAATGPWFTYHFRKPTDTFDFAICVPVASDVRAVGRVEPGERPAVKAARTVLHGNYTSLGAAWGELRDWIAAQSHATGPAFWECYAVGPETSSDPADWRTELTWPLAEDAPVTTE